MLHLWVYTFFFWVYTFFFWVYMLFFWVYTFQKTALYVNVYAYNYGSTANYG